VVKQVITEGNEANEGMEGEWESNVSSLLCCLCLLLWNSELLRAHAERGCRFIAIKLVPPGFGRKVHMLTEHRLPGVRLPLDGAFPLLLFPALQCRGRIGDPETDVNKEQEEQVMTITTEKTPAPASGGQRALKSIHDAIAKAARLNPSKTGKAAPSCEAIGTKAYEIWMSRGQEQGHDQEHWFEAERQLQQG
jgi:hypothetical protein